MLSRDPHRPLDVLAGGSAAGRFPVDRGGAALRTASLPPRGGIVPADLRAAIHQALALLPGVRITDSSTDPDGRTGVALGIVNAVGEVPAG